MTEISHRETARQYRVLKQTLSMHCDLRDEYTLKSRIARIVILVGGAVVCCTTFASDELYRILGFAPDRARVIMGISGIGIFTSSLALLVLDWSGKAAEHRDAARRWGETLKRFRTARLGDKTWPDDVSNELSDLYWETSEYTVEIPGKRFNRLKARHLRKEIISRLKSRYPGSPRAMLWILVRLRHTWEALRDDKLGGKKNDKQEGQE